MFFLRSLIKLQIVDLPQSPDYQPLTNISPVTAIKICLYAVSCYDYKMHSSLKNFVEEFIQKKQIEQFPHLYIVDKQTGPYWTIQQAIDAALPNSLIKISQGFYEENLVINKPLRLEPKKESQQFSKIGVVILASQGIAVHIKLPQADDQVTFSGMKFSHSGNSASNLKKELLQHQHILNIFQQHQNIEQLQNQFINRMSPTKMESIIVFIERGKFTSNNCLFSLSYLVKSCTTTIPAIWAEKQATLNLNNSEVKGHEVKSTIGIVCRLGAFYIQNSIISNHKEGGLLVWGVKGNRSKIIKNFIQQNSVGIHLVGQQFKLSIISNSINKNGVGIKVGLASQPQISRNIICQNGEGIQIHSAFPSITLNKIQKSKQNGIVCRSYKKFICKAEVKKNISIVGNKLNGVLIQGQNNRSVVSSNHMIGFNGEVGVKIQKQAFPVISNNKIYKNYKEGILVVQSSSGMIQKNEISHNIQCNIAIGGKYSHHSALIDNIVSDSPGTGIYIIKAGRLKVIRNDVFNNQNGIICTGSSSEIMRNNIYQNRDNGVVCQSKAHPTFTQNFVTRNSGVGLLIRGGSCSKNSSLHSNIIVSNQIDVGIQEYEKDMLKKLTGSNTIEKEIYYPEGLPCTVM